MRVAAQDAIQPFRQAFEKRDLDARLISWALRSLAWSRTDGDMARIRRECTEILAELPADVSESEGWEALRPTVAEACPEITKRQAEKERQTRKVQLVGEGLAQVNSYMLELLRQDEITREEYLNSDFTRQLQTAVQCGLESEMTGDETIEEARELAREIIDSKIE